MPLDVNRLYLNHLTVMGAHRRDAGGCTHMLADGRGEGQFKALIDRIMPLSQVVKAHELVESRGILGKIILDPTQ